MATGMRYDLADPETDPGWDYTTPGGVQRGQPSIAIWSWARRGQFPPDTQVAEAHSEVWQSLTAVALEISARARAQYARELFLSSDDMQWFCLTSSGAIDTMSYTGRDMIHYLGNGQLPEDTQLCGTTGQRGVPPRSEFKRFHDLLEQFMGERVPLPRPVTPHSEGDRENGNSLVGNGDSTVQSNGGGGAAIPDKKTPPPVFAELQKMYRDALFGDPGFQWYTWYNDAATGPFPRETMWGLSSNDSLPSTYPLRGVPVGSSAPKQSEFKPLEDLLLEIHTQRDS